ncbi:MAG: hypothetical protein WD278_00180, partial [Pirellulales bacterium]
MSRQAVGGNLTTNHSVFLNGAQLKPTTKQLLFLVGSLVAAAGVAAAQSARPAKEKNTPERLMAEIEAMKDPNVAWRGIAWKSCLLDALEESRRQNKPL